MLITLIIIFAILFAISLAVYVVSHVTYTYQVEAFIARTKLILIFFCAIVLTALIAAIIYVSCTHTEEVYYGTYDIIKLDVESDKEYYIYTDTDGAIIHLYYYDGYNKIPLSLIYNEDFLHPVTTQENPHIAVYEEILKPNNDFIGFLIPISEKPKRTYCHVYANTEQIFKISTKDIK